MQINQEYLGTFTIRLPGDSVDFNGHLSPAAPESDMIEHIQVYGEELEIGQS
jgi:hypothetical protein